MRIAYTLLSFLLLILSVNATSNTITALLQSYNVSPAIISVLTSVNITYQNKNYTELSLISQPYFLVNASAKPYAFVLNATSVYNIIRNTTIAASANTVNLGTVKSSVSAYLNTSAGPLNDCLTVTGLNRGLTCTLSNYCQSCAYVPACYKVLYGTGGPGGVFGLGITQLQSAYNNLTSNVSTLYSYTANVAAGNLLTAIARVTAAFANISAITRALYQNPVFPPLASSNRSLCNAVGSFTQNVPLKGAPWYCNAVGFCQFLSYNYTMLANIQSNINSINSVAPTNQYITAIAQNITNTENRFIFPLFYKQKLAQLSLALNTTLINYSRVVNRTNILLMHIGNRTLYGALSQLQQNYNRLKTGFQTLNITTYSSVVANSLANVTLIYGQNNATYTGLLNLAKNNTRLLIALQFGGTDLSASDLAFKQNQLNYQILGSISNTSSASSNLTAINRQAAVLAPPGYSPAELSRAIDGPFATAIASSLGFSYPVAVSLVPSLASLLSLIIGAILFSLFFMMYQNMRKSNRIIINKRTIRAWHDLFAIIALIIALYAILTYVYASSANSYVPVSVLKSALTNAKSIGIVLNGTTNPGMISCANQLYNQSLSLGKRPSTAYVNGARCSVGTSLSTTGACLASYVAHGTPIIMLTNSSVSSINAYSMYGTAIYVSGNQSFMNQCYASLFLR